MTYIEASGDDLDDTVQDALAQVVMLGNTPTRRERSSSPKQSAATSPTAPRAGPAAACGGTGLITTVKDSVS